MTVKECVHCEKWSMKQTTTTHQTTYKGQDLLLTNVTVWECEHCEENVYGTGYLLKTIRYAKKVYDETGETTIDVSKNQ